MSITAEDVKAALAAVIDPNTQKDFVSSKCVKNIKVEGADVAILEPDNLGHSVHRINRFVTDCELLLQVLEPLP